MKNIPSHPTLFFHSDSKIALPHLVNLEHERWGAIGKGGGENCAKEEKKGKERRWDGRNLMLMCHVDRNISRLVPPFLPFLYTYVNYKSPPSHDINLAQKKKRSSLIRPDQSMKNFKPHFPSSPRPPQSQAPASTYPSGPSRQRTCCAAHTWPSSAASSPPSYGRPVRARALWSRG